jgi:hypothetical protein
MYATPGEQLVRENGKIYNSTRGHIEVGRELPAYPGYILQIEWMTFVGGGYAHVQADGTVVALNPFGLSTVVGQFTD